MGETMRPTRQSFRAEDTPPEIADALLRDMGLACYDCGLPYGDLAWIEAVVPHDIWNEHLSPTGDEGGLLCINCMARRAIDAGLSDVPVKLTAGPFCAADA